MLFYFNNLIISRPEKASHFINSWRGNGRVQLFRADLMEEGSFDEAVRGCDGVFHVAASMEFSVPPAQDDLGNYCIYQPHYLN